MIDLNQYKKIATEKDDRLPLLTLEEFFEGNRNEDSIAPNQWGYGRPSLSEIYDTLKKVESIPNVAWVRVVLHDDTEVRESDGIEILDLYGDTIALCTTANPFEIEQAVNCEWLCSDGVIVTDPSELRFSLRVPPIPEGFRCFEIVWD